MSNWSAYWRMPSPKQMEKLAREQRQVEADPVTLRSLLDRGLRDKRFDAAVLKAIREGRGLSSDTQIKMRTAYRQMERSRVCRFGTKRNLQD